MVGAKEVGWCLTFLVAFGVGRPALIGVRLSETFGGLAGQHTSSEPEAEGVAPLHPESTLRAEADKTGTLIHLYEFTSLARVSGRKIRRIPPFTLTKISGRVFRVQVGVILVYRALSTAHRSRSVATWLVRSGRSGSWLLFGSGLRGRVGCRTSRFLIHLTGS